MFSGVGQVEAADPPPNLEPDTPPSINPAESDEEAEEKPGDEGGEGGEEEDGLRLGDPLDGIEGEEGGQEGGEGGVNAGADLPVVEAGAEEGAAAVGEEVVAWVAGAAATVVAEGVCRARHGSRRFEAGIQQLRKLEIEDKREKKREEESGGRLSQTQLESGFFNFIFGRRELWSRESME